MVRMPVVVSRRLRVAGPDALDMMVMAPLRQANFVLEAEHGLAIFAQPAVHRVVAAPEVGDALDEGLDRQRVVGEPGRLDEFDLRIAGRRRGRYARRCA